MKTTRIRKSTFIFIICFCILLVTSVLAVSMLQYILESPTNNEISADDTLPPKDNTTIDDLRPDKDNNNDTKEDDTKKPDISRPMTSYQIMDYAFALLPTYKNIVCDTTSCIGKNILGRDINQKFRVKYQRNGKQELEENYSYGFSNFYRYGYSSDGESYKFVYTGNIDENFNYNLSGAEVQTCTKQDIIDKYQKDMFKEMLLTPNKKIGIITTFDRISDDDFMIINFSLTSFPEDYINSYKTSIGTDTVIFNSSVYRIYIARGSYRLALIEKSENFTFTYFGANINVSTTAKTTFTYPEDGTIYEPHN